MKTTSYTPTNWKEARRLRAWELKQEGWSQRAIAEALGISDGAVSQWIKSAREGGVEALRHTPPPGRPPGLTEKQLQRLDELLRQGSSAHDYVGDIWTRARVGSVIEEHFHIRYDDSHVGRILKKIGWTLQKPVRQARQRDDSLVEKWRSERWPEIKKKQ